MEFWTICSANGIVLDKKQMDQIERYAGELIYWNSKVNMISRKDEENVMSYHILHSLSILKYADIPHRSLCLDIGSGGGLPGIPVSIARPDLRMLLIDSIAKKVKMAEMFASHTGNKSLKAIRARAEELHRDKEYGKRYDYIFSRSVAKVEKILEWSQSIRKKDTVFIMLKGGDLSDEIHSAKERFKNLDVKEHLISLIGYDKFEKEEKKILICKFL